MLDIEILRIIWWLLLGVLFMGFAVTDGFDLGVAILLPLVAKNETERRIVLNTIGPFWEGNQVWIILGAGAIFAAWPYVYAATFSTFYLLMLLHQNSRHTKHFELLGHESLFCFSYELLQSLYQ